MTDDNPPASTFHAQGSSEPDEGPTLAQRVRTLVALGGQSTLSTVSKKHPGMPFGSMMPYGQDDQGRPMFLISSMAVHTRNLKEDPNCSLFITRTAAGGTPLGAARGTLMGSVESVPDVERESAMKSYLQRQPEAKQWASYGDFGLYRLNIADIYFVGGFGIMGWVSPEEYAAAQPDPLAEYADEIMEHVNSDHNRAVLVLARSQWGITATQAMMTSIDELGFDARLLTSQGAKGIRINFTQPAKSPEDVRTVMTAMVREATQGPAPDQ